MSDKLQLSQCGFPRCVTVLIKVFMVDVKRCSDTSLGVPALANYCLSRFLDEPILSLWLVADSWLHPRISESPLYESGQESDMETI